MKITGLSHLFKWENLHNWWLTKYFFAPLYISYALVICISKSVCTYRRFDVECVFQGACAVSRRQCLIEETHYGADKQNSTTGVCVYVHSLMICSLLFCMTF